MNLHNDLKHPNIIDLKKCFEDEKNIYILLEYSENGVSIIQHFYPHLLLFNFIKLFFDVIFIYSIKCLIANIVDL